MADFDVNELRRIPSFYDSDDHFNGGNKLEPNPCSSVEFEDCTFIDCLFDDCKYTETQGKLFGMN